MLSLLLVSIFVYSFVSLRKPAVVQAAPSNTIVINELMYNPASDNDDDEYLELYNTTASPIDLENWCFTDGITLVTANPTDSSCFESGTTIAANGYLLVSPNPTQTNTAYGQTAAASYAGSKLSNGGETVTLQDNTATTINTITYDDAPPWPASPDGTGPSLELKDPSLDNNDPANWGASLSDGGTPKAINSITSADLPTISDVSQVTDASDSDTPTVTATISNEDTVELIYKVMFEAEVTIDMYDDGTNGDATPGDGIYTTQIPTQDAGELVRYKVSADNTNGTTTNPGTDDTINYYGYTVDYDVQEGALPVIDWYIADDDYTELINKAVDDDSYVDCVIVYGNTVVDNAQIRQKGNYSRGFSKKAYKVKLPKGIELTMPDISDYPLHEFHLNSDFPNGNEYIDTTLAWKVFEYAGFPTPQYQKVQIQKNGQFEGAYLLSDKYDKEWQTVHPEYSKGEIWDAWWEKELPKDDTDDSNRDEWRNKTLNLQGEELHKYIRDNYNMPNMINYMAVSFIIQHHDWTTQQNLISFRDTGNTNRWSVLPWDLDLTFTSTTANEPDARLDIDPHVTPDYLSEADRFFANAIWDDTELRQLYLRRTRTLLDEIYASGRINQWAEEAISEMQSTIDLDYAKWNDPQVAQDEIDGVISYITGLGLDPNDPEVIAAYYKERYGLDENVQPPPDPIDSIAPLSLNNMLYLKFTLGLPKWANTINTTYQALPTSLTGKQDIVINEFNYRPLGGSDHEYLEFFNPNDYAVDMSNWQVSGIGLTLPGGSVIPAKSYAIVVKNDSVSRQYYGGGVLVLSEYTGNLSNSGETLTLRRADSSIASSVTYTTNGDWSPLANGNGYSQALIRSAADETLPACWAPSANGGTPGATNTNFDQAWLNTHQDDCRDRDYSSASSSLADTGLNHRLITGLSLVITTTAGAWVYRTLYLHKTSEVYLSGIDRGRKR